MLLISMKENKKRIIAIAIGILLILVIGIPFFIFCNSSKNNSYALSSQGSYSLEAKDRAGRINFLKQFGWEVEEEEIEICDIVIPNSFNQVFENYNEIQKQQGLDLSPYMGKVCKRFTYKVTNYPNNLEEVYADILILDSLVIGGDVCSAEQGGFIHSFYNPESNNEDTASTSSTKQLSYQIENSNAVNTMSVDKNMPNAPID